MAVGDPLDIGVDLVGDPSAKAASGQHSGTSLVIAVKVGSVD
jgi:hypothetical protein